MKLNRWVSRCALYNRLYNVGNLIQCNPRVDYEAGGWVGARVPTLTQMGTVGDPVSWPLHPVPHSTSGGPLAEDRPWSRVMTQFVRRSGSAVYG